MNDWSVPDNKSGKKEKRKEVDLATAEHWQTNEFRRFWLGTCFRLRRMTSKANDKRLQIPRSWYVFNAEEDGVCFHRMTYDINHATHSVSSKPASDTQHGQLRAWKPATTSQPATESRTIPSFHCVVIFPRLTALTGSPASRITHRDLLTQSRAAKSRLNALYSSWLSEATIVFKKNQQLADRRAHLSTVSRRRHSIPLARFSL